MNSFFNKNIRIIKDLLFEHKVIFFRNQNLTPENEIRFAKRWGEINTNRFFSSVEGFPQIALVVKEPDQKNNIGGSWHTDHSTTSIRGTCFNIGYV